jgi:hypothetical protein
VAASALQLALDPRADELLAIFRFLQATRTMPHAVFECSFEGEAVGPTLFSLAVLESVLPLASVCVVILERCSALAVKLTELICRTFLPGNYALKGCGLVISERLRLLILVSVDMVERAHLL